MKKNLLALIFLTTLALCLTACGNSEENLGNQAPGDPAKVEKALPEPAPKPLDLSGEWRQTNSNSDDTYQALYISENRIEVYWVMESDDTTALYWAGTYEAPTSERSAYSWDSSNDHDITSTALLASGDDTKTFTFEDGKLLYSVSAFGETMEVEATKQEWGYTSLTTSSSESAGAMVGSGDLGAYHVEIKSAKLAEDYDGNPAIIVTYSWTNNSDETTSAMVSIGEKAFQDGVQLDTAFIMDSTAFDADSGMKEIRPGTTIDVQCAFLLTSETSTVEVELTEWISFSDDMVTMDFDPTSL